MSSRARALVIEDEYLVALGLESELRALGFDVCDLAANASEAMSLARRERPDIMVADIDLSDIRDGIETAKRLRALCAVPIIFVTAYGHHEGIVSRAHEQVPGAPVLAKPLQRDQLAEAVAEVEASVALS